MRRAAFVATLGAAVALPAVALADTEVHIALPTLSLDSFPALLAQDKGFFAKHGIKADLIIMHSGSEAMKAFIAGDAEVVATGFPEVGELRAHGVDVQLLVEANQRIPMALVARADLHAKSIADLKGKSIGISGPGSITDFTGRYMISRQGWDVQKDVGWVAVGNGAEMLGALSTKKIDGAVLQEPFISQGLKSGAITMVADYLKLPYMNAFPSGPFTVRRDYLTKSPAAAKGVHDAIVDALHYIHDNKADAFAVARKTYAGLDPDVLETAFNRMWSNYSPDGKFSRPNIDLTQTICKQLGVMSTTYPFDDVVSALGR